MRISFQVSRRRVWIGCVVLLVCALAVAWFFWSGKEEELERTEAPITQNVIPEGLKVPVLYSLNGKIKKLGNNSLVLDTSAAISLPGATDVPVTRTVNVVASTTLVRIQPRTVAYISQNPTSTAPSPELPIKFSDLKVGERVSVSATEDISTSTLFSAEKITVF